MRAIGGVTELPARPGPDVGNLAKFDPKQLLPSEAEMDEDSALAGLKQMRSGLSDLSSIFSESPHHDVASS